MPTTLELACPACQWTEVCGPGAMLGWLRSVKMARRDTEPDPELIAELFRSAVDRFECPECHAKGLIALASQADAEEQDDEAWGMARICQGCQRPIPRERLEVFPNTRLCVDCQAKDDRGEQGGAAEYCPRCGNVMVLRQSSGAGLARYKMTCPSCRK
jgi:RNA polymerase-binding transcription factor DksA